MESTLRVDGRLRNLLALDGLAFLLCAAALYAIYRVPLLLSPLALALLIIGVAALLGLDVAIWVRRGIHSIELGADALTLYRGRGLRAVRVDRAAVLWVRASRRLGRGSVVVGLSGGRRIRIREDPFPSAEFGRFVAALQQWR